MKRPQLDERLRRILTFVVESHVSRAEPVGSQYVRAAYHLSISPATIRSAMQQLEELGLLSHPHTSAGRIPTQAGYRYYVDELMRLEPIPLRTRRALDDAIGRARVEARADGVPPILARASRQLAVMAVQAQEERTVERVDLVPLEGGLVVLAVGARDGAVLTATWNPAVPVSPVGLRRGTSWIRSRLPVIGPAGLEALGRSARTEAPTDLAALLEEALGRAARMLAARDGPEVRMDGADNIASQPEFQGPGRLRPLVALLANQGTLARALESFAGEVTPRVAIGSENSSPEVRACSIVGIGVVVGGTPGVLGVVGPVRMPYRRIISLVSYVGDRLAGA